MKAMNLIKIIVFVACTFTFICSAYAAYTLLADEDEEVAAKTASTYTATVDSVTYNSLAIVASPDKMDIASDTYVVITDYTESSGTYTAVSDKLSGDTYDKCVVSILAKPSGATVSAIGLCMNSTDGVVKISGDKTGVYTFDIYAHITGSTKYDAYHVSVSVGGDGLDDIAASFASLGSTLLIVICVFCAIVDGLIYATWRR